MGFAYSYEEEYYKFKLVFEGRPMAMNQRSARRLNVRARADIQRSKINLQTKSCCCFSQLESKINLEQELSIPALDSN